MFFLSGFLDTKLLCCSY